MRLLFLMFVIAVCVLFLFYESIKFHNFFAKLEEVIKFSLLCWPRSNPVVYHILASMFMKRFCLSKINQTKHQTFFVTHCLEDISSRIFENIPRNGPEYSHRNLAIARFLVTAVRKNISGLLSWLVSLSSSVPELTRHGLERGLHVNP